MAIKIINGVKCYPAFNTEAHAHDFEYQRNHALNTLDDAHHGIIDLTPEQEAELEATVEKTEAVLARLSFPLTYLPWELYKFAKETMAWATCSRDQAMRGVNSMTKREFLAQIDGFDDDADMNEVLRALEEERMELIERIEERQHKNGMYAQQDLIDMYRRER